MRIINSTDTRAIAALLDTRSGRDRLVQRRVATIVDRVRREGDRALLRYARTLDGLDQPMLVTTRELEESVRQVNPTVRRAIAVAARHIRRVAGKQRPREWQVSPTPGVTIRQRVLPLDRVGCYVPGGRYPLPSSLLMTAIPARVAGVAEVIAVCPKPDPTVMVAALEAGVTRLLRIGGAHAIAALAYGTATVPRVDKIVGPGNAYVAAAKARVSADCAIDFFAGPSEIAVVSTAGRPEWIAADLIAQAEHDPEARAIFLTPSRRLARAVAREVERRLPPQGPAPRALAARGGIILSRSLDAQAAGDYVTGSNHVLPTGGAAAARGGLNTADFVRVATVQRISAQGFRRIAPAGIALAAAEGLRAHAESLRIRLARP
jgi:histidinol dehydrogenase